MSALTRIITSMFLFIAAESQINEWANTLHLTVNGNPVAAASTWTGFMSGASELNTAIGLFTAIWGWSHPQGNPMPQVLSDLSSIKASLHDLKNELDAIYDDSTKRDAKWTDIIVFLEGNTDLMNTAISMNSTIPGSVCYGDDQCWYNEMDHDTLLIRTVIEEQSLVRLLYDAVVEFMDDGSPNNLQRFGYMEISDNFPYFDDWEWGDWQRQLQRYEQWMGYLVNKVQQMQILILFCKSWLGGPHSSEEPWRDAFVQVERLNDAMQIMIKTHYDATAWSRTAASFYDKTYGGDERVFKLYKWDENNYSGGDLNNVCYGFVRGRGMVAQNCPGHRDWPVENAMYIYPLLDGSNKFVFKLYGVTPNKPGVHGTTYACDEYPGPSTLYWADKREPDETFEWTCDRESALSVQLNFWPAIEPKDPCYMGVWDKVHVQADHYLLEEHKLRNAKYWDFIIIPDGGEPDRQSCMSQSLYECAHGWWSDTSNPHITSDKEKCLVGGPGWVWSGGDASKAPGCVAHCKCCKPLRFPGGVVPEFPEQDSSGGNHDKDAYECYHYSEFDLAKGLTDKEMCEGAGYGIVYTGGDNDKAAPGCGNCSCCQSKQNPVDETRFGTRFECHHYTDDEKDRMLSGSEPESWVCQGAGHGFLYTEGQDRLAPGCGGCYCCKPETTPGDGQFECYVYDDDESTLIDQLRENYDDTASERAVCLSGGFGFVFTDGDDSLAPGCDGSCHCCQPVVRPAERYTGYSFTDEDMSITGISERERCLTSGAGFVYTDRDDHHRPFGNQAVAPGCGRWDQCCKPDVPTKDRFECHHWTDGDKEAMAHDLDPEYVCRVYDNYVYTGGDGSLAPGCGRCSCCKPL